MSSNEVRTTSSSGGRKGVKEERPDLIPVVQLRALAVHYGRGAEKYTERDARGAVVHDGANNWRLGYEWSKSYAALQRHAMAFWQGEDVDEETGSLHLIAAAWHALTLAEFLSNPEKYGRFDDRPSTEAVVNEDVEVEGDGLDAGDWVIHTESMAKFAEYIASVAGSQVVIQNYNPNAAVYEGLPEVDEDADTIEAGDTVVVDTEGSYEPDGCFDPMETYTVTKKWTDDGYTYVSIQGRGQGGWDIDRFRKADPDPVATSPEPRTWNALKDIPADVNEVADRDGEHLHRNGAAGWYYKLKLASTFVSTYGPYTEIR
ncbi:hypothetical protein BH762_gp056 [Gordonia phage OneUp]|uniref:dATP/dGTP diphosphohydrolase N-terminal domain-containing protein n=1 Tax=Gordonia phage OneUp TaxID=1838074 RepID=A0A166Y9H5_9CAUD|nr:hypothetical protein BH762_gp056 [Gordonia phage OneUp]ANA86463.1 hypothetical protein PBI_ONEUP_129 [Gordonia phage OneUp]